MNRLLRTTLALCSLSLVGVAVAPGCSSSEDPTPGAEEADYTECRGAAPDDSGVCRLPNGRFAASSCCAAAACIFGESFWQIEEGETDAEITSQRIVSAADTLTPLEESQIIAGVKTAYEEVVTLQDAFEAVDQGEVYLYGIDEKDSWRNYLAVEFGAGDNSYGAILAAGSTHIASLIQDGDLYECDALAGGEPECEELDDWATDVCLPGDEEAADGDRCLSSSPHGDARSFGEFCCNSGEYGWCAWPAGITGVVDEVFIGEMDPFVVGDVCVLWIDPYDDSRKTVGVIDDTCDYAITYSDRLGFAVFVAEADLEAVNSEEAEVLSDYRGDTDYYRLMFGSIDSIE